MSEEKSLELEHNRILVQQRLMGWTLWFLVISLFVASQKGLMNGIVAGLVIIVLGSIILRIYTEQRSRCEDIEEEIK